MVTAIGNAVQRTRVEMGFLAALRQPDQHSDEKQPGEQHRNGGNDLRGEEAGQCREHAALRLGVHRDAEAGGEIGMGEIETCLAFEGHRDSRNRGVDLPPLHGVEKTGKIVVVFTKFERHLQVGRDLLPQFDAQSVPLPIIAAQNKGRHAHGADDHFRRVCARVGLCMRGCDGAPQKECHNKQQPRCHRDRSSQPGRRRRHRATGFVPMYPARWNNACPLADKQKSIKALAVPNGWPAVTR
jgi:hypothetical protein